MSSKQIRDAIEYYDDCKAELVVSGERMAVVAKDYGYNATDSKDYRSAKVYLLGVLRGGK
jgi:hypothetical protein